MTEETTPRISIVIPVYNGEDYIGNCLDSIFKSDIKIPFEIIVVDDGSTDRTAQIAGNFTCRYFKITKSGVAAARNIGIKESRGGIIFFFDADVRLKKDTIAKFMKHFQEDNDAYVIQGRWDRCSYAPTFASRFLLLKYLYNFKGLFRQKRRLEVANLETGCLAMRAEVFKYFNGFDERYKFSGGEEHELGMRLLKRYKIYYYDDIFVEHIFGSILKTLGKIYRRTINFSILSFKAKDKNFMRLHIFASIRDRISIMIIFALACSLPLWFINISFAAAATAILLAAYIMNIVGLLFYLSVEESILFAIKGAAADFTIMIPRLLGLAKAVVVYYVLRQKEFAI